ncbi:MAG: hypothetical protein WCX17_02840 [Parcubacteria group bacterium]|jgi:hypothetical protein
MLGQSILGSAYNIPGKYAVFQVMEIEPYPKEKVSKRYKEILKFRPGVLVAVPYRGILIPNITITGGAVRLLQVEVDGDIFKNPKAICEAIGVTEAMHPYDLKKF